MSADFSDTPETRRWTMEAIGSSGTAPEEEAAEMLDALGVGYEEQVRFGRYVVDFVLEDGTVLQTLGCFWHGCPCVKGMDEVDRHSEYWDEKLAVNKERDRRRRMDLLAEHGVPYVFWVWEHQDVGLRVSALCERRGLA